MKKISALDQGYSQVIDHQSAQTAKWLNSFKIHE